VEIIDWGDADAVCAALENLDNDIAAVLMEPLLVNSGLLQASSEFLHAVREACDKSGTVLVFDEVITGFRIARGGAAERYGVTPDLVVLAKAIAGGYPLAAVAGSSAIIDKVTAGVVHAGTYNGNPVVLAAAVATLEALDEPGVYESFESHGEQLARGLATAFSAHGRVATVHQTGPIVQVIPNVAAATTLDAFLRADQTMYDAFIVEMLRRGQFLLPGGRWYISTAHTDADIEETISAAHESLSALA